MIPFKEIIKIIYQAGDILLSYHKKDIHTKYKEDKSPVTEADLAASHFISKSLHDLLPKIPIVSEENSTEENDKYIDAPSFWAVDPLDGTRSFIRHEDGFTINIGLIVNKKPVIGFVLIPALKKLYYNKDQSSAYEVVGNNAEKQIKSVDPSYDGLVVLSSTAYNHHTLDFIKNYKVKEFIPTSSASKICSIASGYANLYPRFGKTMEWDTAAGQAILEAAGGKIVTLDNKPLSYGKKNFANPNFIAFGKNVEF